MKNLQWPSTAPTILDLVHAYLSSNIPSSLFDYLAPCFHHICLLTWLSLGILTALLCLQHSFKGRELRSRSLKFHFLNKAFLENLTQNISSIIPLLVFMFFFFLSCENIKCYCLIFLCLLESWCFLSCSMKAGCMLMYYWILYSSFLEYWLVHILNKCWLNKWTNKWESSHLVLFFFQTEKSHISFKTFLNKPPSKIY